MNYNIQATFVSLLEIEGPSTMREINSKYSVSPDLKISMAAANARGRGYCTKIAGTDGKKNVYKITAIGRKYLKEFSGKLVPLDLLQTYKKETREQPEPELKNVSPVAHKAMDFTAQLIEENQRLNNILRRLYMQLKPMFDDPEDGNQSECNQSSNTE